MPDPVDVRDVSGASTATAVLDESLFGVEPNTAVLHQVVTAQLAAGRAGTQSTKTRAEVAGGGRKPFKQKGTGRARQGSERAPHFTGGGVALGPKPRSYRQRTPKKMIKLALRSALSDRAAEGKVAVVDGWPWETPSTKEAIAALSALGLTGKVLVVLTRDDEEAYRSFRNLTEVQLMLVGELNAYDILCNDWVVFTRETLPGETQYSEAPAGAEASDSAAAPSRKRSTRAAVVEPEAEAEPESEAEPDEVAEAAGVAGAAEVAEAGEVSPVAAAGVSGALLDDEGGAEEAVADESDEEDEDDE